MALEYGKEPGITIRFIQSRPLPLRLVQFFLLFLVLGLGVSVISMYTFRHFGIQNVTDVGKSSIFIPCFEAPNDLEHWIKPSSNLLHRMNDTELFWRASFLPRRKGYPFKRVPKIAFMFLTKGPLPLAPLWERFLKGHEGLYSIYVHSLPSYVGNYTASSVFYNRQIPSQVLDLLSLFLLYLLALCSICFIGDTFYFTLVLWIQLMVFNFFIREIVGFFFNN